MSIVFVTGTDTGVGKTFVSCALALALRDAGQRVGVLKPIETGVIGDPEDAMRLREAADDPSPLDDVCPYRLRAPLAPAAAAPAEGVVIDVERIVALIERRAATVDVLVVEGAGGLLVPITATCTYLDLALRLALPTLIVAANRLGTLNHCALTARVARAAGLHVHGIVLSQPAAETDPSAASNPTLVAAMTALPVLAVLPHRPDSRSSAGSMKEIAQLCTEIP